AGCCAPEVKRTAPLPASPTSWRRWREAPEGAEGPRSNVELVSIAACSFAMGNDSVDAVPGDGEGPVRRVSLSAYAIAPAVVTNRAFGDFVRATRYVTEAEQAGSSFVFYLQVPAARR